jgi:hypothetical protein
VHIFIEVQLYRGIFYQYLILEMSKHLLIGGEFAVADKLPLETDIAVGDLRPSGATTVPSLISLIQFFLPAFRHGKPFWVSLWVLRQVAVSSSSCDIRDYQAFSFLLRRLSNILTSGPCL